jgi:hypothetical protein
MATQISKTNDPAVPDKLLEVDFALVISRMIDTVKDDPAQLRKVVYELARTKLRDEIKWADGEEEARHLDALESAIHGVEGFTLREQRAKRAELPGPDTAPQPQLLGPVAGATSNMGDRNAVPQPDASIQSAVAQLQRGQRRLVYIGLGLLIVGSAAATLLYQKPTRRGDVVVARSGLEAGRAANPPATTVTANEAARATPTPAPGPPGVPVPSVYGVYAVHDNKLIELQEMAEHVPDKRIAISTPIGSPPRTTIPDGRISFVVFRRDMATFAASTADVRVIAKVARVTAFDSNGKPMTAPLEGVWSMRSVAFQFRAAPMPDKPEIFILKSDNDDFVLPAGRYALALNGQGFDFAIAGPLTDKNQCLERTDAANGSFYAQCKG